MLTVVAAYRQNVHAYPSGGGDYEVANTNLGPKFGAGRGQRAAGRLRADRRRLDLGRRRQPRLDACRSPGWPRHQVAPRSSSSPSSCCSTCAVCASPASAFAIPTYAFMFGIIVDDRGRSSGWSSDTTCVARRAGVPASGRSRTTGHRRAPASSGCARSPPAVRRSPVSRRSPTACRRSEARRPRTPRSPSSSMGAIALDHVRRHHGPGPGREGPITANPGDLQSGSTAPAAEDGDRPGRRGRCSAAPSIGFFYIQATTALILVLAANTAFNGFPLLGRDPRPGQEPAPPAAQPR